MAGTWQRGSAVGVKRRRARACARACACVWVHVCVCLLGSPGSLLLEGLARLTSFSRASPGSLLLEGLELGELGLLAVDLYMMKARENCQSGETIQVGSFLDSASSSTRMLHGAHVQVSGRNRFDSHWCKVERLAVDLFGGHVVLVLDVDQQLAHLRAAITITWRRWRWRWRHVSTRLNRKKEWQKQPCRCMW